MTIPFKEFPLSYRFSQTSIGLTLLTLAVAGPLFRVVPEKVRVVMFAVLGVVVLGSLLVSNYVLIRYPYISLVEPENGDPFSKHFASQGSWLYWALKLFGLATAVVVTLSMIVVGIDSPAKMFALAYGIALTLFMVFLTFFFQPLKHPTISTFIRSTLGLGIAFFPLFAVSIAIGSLRCRRLLDSRGEQVEQGPA